MILSGAVSAQSAPLAVNRCVLGANDRSTRRRPLTNFGVYDSAGALCGYARVLTDRATFAWLCDVYINRPFRGRGLGRVLAQAVVDTLTPRNINRLLLSTRLMRTVLRAVGFVPFPDLQKLMILR